MASVMFCAPQTVASVLTPLKQSRQFGMALHAESSPQQVPSTQVPHAVGIEKAVEQSKPPPELELLAVVLALELLAVVLELLVVAAPPVPAVPLELLVVVPELELDEPPVPLALELDAPPVPLALELVAAVVELVLELDAPPAPCGQTGGVEDAL